MEPEITTEQMQELVVSAVQQAVESVFGIMLASSPEFVEACQISHPLKESESVQALIGLAGPWIGTGAIMCSPGLACQLAGTLLMSEYEYVCEDVLDAIAEIANMVIGNVKTTVEDRVGLMGLSTPTIIYGRSFTTKIVGHNNWTLVRFQVLGGEFIVQAALHRNADSSKASRFEFIGHMMTKS